MMDSKTNKERDILNSIYKDIPNLEIKRGDKPDFRLSHKEGKYYFGVEVTEFYFSESSARLRNIPEYVGELLSNKKYRHKDDKKKLEIDKIAIISKNGHKKDETVGIIQKLPGLSNYLKKINQIIKSKNKKFSNYDKTLNHINLIIYDTENYLFTIRLKYFFNIFYSKDIIKSLVKSEFREIYFITTVEKDKKLYFPLKMILFLSKIYLFNYFLCKDYKANLDLNEEDSYNFFLEYLNYQGFSGIRKRMINQHIEIIYGNVGFYLEDENKTTLRNYQDYKLPTDAEIIKIKKYNFINEEVRKSINKFHDLMSFQTEIGFKIKNSI